ncbi:MULTISPECIES: mucoid induction factor MucE [Pseudomonas aeruginosa group]|uniref:mucoid induction factor MucE n=1 Tax=Pseudomonas aeruginosa group TaxID=136841 RepID=UPI00086DE21C|nr:MULTISPECIES: mucoid induction factor MucE [Pseudomonas aeruginosa group]AVR66285.1 hypothetical protein B7D75_04585 [Pseudomonas paraeruginosa]MBG3903314.1 mucoid induction factor MucE [Pseudomonas aeruginosa]MBG4202758.1 mucoid induction factor MucE [Pseudomonas aeruginosa]MBG4280839.1 mucoid induction factor MucE [Pseudomonas aeruginosa]MBG6890956.1 mucoid induction factor MucE [Pseudomonas aeruginosa]
MGFRPVRQRLRDINLQAFGKFSCLALILGLESVGPPSTTPLAPVFNQGTSSPSFAAPLGLDNSARAGVELWNVGLSGAVSVRDETRWVF